MMKTTLGLSLLIVMAAGCGQGYQAADPSAITARSDAWEEALNAGDVDALVALYTSDARIMAPNEPTAIGSDAVRAVFGGMVDAGLGGTLTSVEASVAGDIGYNVGTYALKAGDETVDTGKFIEIWKRDSDGEWRISSDIYNSDAPAAGGGAERTHLMIVHEVEDGEHWMNAWRGENSRANDFMANGAAHVHTLRNADNPNLTGLIVSVEDMDAIQAFLTSEEGAAAAEADGVDLDDITVLVEAE